MEQIKSWLSKIWQLAAISLLSLFVVWKVIAYLWFTPMVQPENKGQLGDAFNGLLSPFIALAGALLVYFSFRAQIRANLIITSQWQFDLLLKTLNDVQESYEKIFVSIKRGRGRLGEPRNFSGEVALRTIAREDWAELNNVETALTDLHTVILEFRFVLDRIEKSQIDDKDFLYLRSSVFYIRKLQIPITDLRTRIIRDQLGNNYPSLIQAFNILQARAFNLQSTGKWGGLV